MIRNFWKIQSPSPPLPTPRLNLQKITIHITNPIPQRDLWLGTTVNLSESPSGNNSSSSIGRNGFLRILRRRETNSVDFFIKFQRLFQLQNGDVVPLPEQKVTFTTNLQIRIGKWTYQISGIESLVQDLTFNLNFKFISGLLCRILIDIQEVVTNQSNDPAHLPSTSSLKFIIDLLSSYVYSPDEAMGGAEKILLLDDGSSAGSYWTLTFQRRVDHQMHHPGKLVGSHWRSVNNPRWMEVATNIGQPTTFLTNQPVYHNSNV